MTVICVVAHYLLTDKSKMLFTGYEKKIFCETRQAISTHASLNFNGKLIGLSRHTLMLLTRVPKSFEIHSLEIVFCWNNCSGYSQEKCFKCNLVFPKLSRLKKGQRVKGF